MIMTYEQMLELLKGKPEPYGVEPLDVDEDLDVTYNGDDGDNSELGA